MSKEGSLARIEKYKKHGKEEMLKNEIEFYKKHYGELEEEKKKGKK